MTNEIKHKETLTTRLAPTCSIGRKKRKKKFATIVLWICLKMGKIATKPSKDLKLMEKICSVGRRIPLQ
jgi:hypothetical protein